MKIVQQPQQVKLAMLIDADNAQPTKIEEILVEVAKHGKVIIKRAYGDWTKSNLNGWKKIVPQFAIDKIQQVAYTVGKNATDIGMTIDAMDLLYSKSSELDGVCLVSSDSDFTPLAIRIHKFSLSVYGFGEQKTPQAFVAACDRFIHTENLPPVPIKVKKAKKVKKAEKAEKNTTQHDGNTRLLNLLSNVIDTKWICLNVVGQQIIQQLPGFKPKNYGYNQLHKLITATKLFEMERRKSSIYVRAR
ncbi:MAG: Maebl [Candidatus Parabeggiatoa sp. nov. 1]|nr:MAG: Maebl [Gammaproteobacteria bacterium]